MNWIKRFAREFDWWSFGTVLVACVIGGVIGVGAGMHFWGP